MSRIRRIFSRLRSLFLRAAAERDMAAEIQAHLELQEQANRARGMDAEEARYAALRQFGGVAQVQERCREQRGWGWPGELLRDLRLAARSLARTPGYAAVAVLLLALAIGANTAVFSLFNAILLRSLPVPNPQELRVLEWSGIDRGNRSISGRVERGTGPSGRTRSDAFPVPATQFSFLLTV